MSQGCLKCLKYTMCVANFLCFLCGTAVLGLGVYMMMTLRLSSLFPTLAALNVSTLLLICGTIITCISFLGFLGALKENRCLLLTFFLLLFILMLAELSAACILLMNDEKVGKWLEKDLEDGLKKIQKDLANNSTTELKDWDWMQIEFECCGVKNSSDWGANVPDSCCVTSPCDKQKRQGCLSKLTIWFEENFLYVGISVIFLCIIEVLAMCFAMTLFCHISRSGLGYKL
ncbi:leukocyte surface antigen CD53-like [Genypterus blacodes]|uniref:leukocyte surface antigen CD53-like n=1 Tax=Genypterus blacodes TaxID=154954 RepID=UPI003F759DA5